MPDYPILKNNNMSAISQMAKRTLKNNKWRSATMILGVMLSAFMLFSVFTVGVTYFKMERLQTIRLQGCDHDAVMYGVTDKQIDLCKKNPDIHLCGIAAVTGYVIETDKDQTPDVGLMWADTDYWEQMCKPARIHMDGSYPTAANEVLVSKKALSEIGYDDLTVGDSFTMTYDTAISNGAADSRAQQTFCISGIWEGYGPQKVIYMSKAFYDQSGNQPSDIASGRFYIDFKTNWMSDKAQNAFIESMHLEKQQTIIFNGDFTHSMQILGGICGLIIVTCLCAYLLIYNIMYLSISGNVRYYGLLQTIGTTARQLYCFIRRQMLLIGIIGTTAGLFFGFAVSFILFPAIIKSMGIQTGIEIAFHPAIVILTIALTSMTIYAASSKPAKLAVSISPMEALGYRPVSRSRKSRKSGKGKLICRLAIQQLLKDKKKSGIIVLSLAASLSVYLCIVTLIDSENVRNYLDSYLDYDLVIQNDTARKDDVADHKQLFDTQLLSGIKNVSGVKDVHVDLCTDIIVPWEPEFAEMWMQEVYEMWMSIPYEDAREEYKQHPENFSSSMVGIDEYEFTQLNQSLSTPIDPEAFLNGNTCIVYRNGLSFTDDELIGQNITCAQYNDAQNTRTFQIAALTNEYYHLAMTGYCPTILVSDRILREFTADPILLKTGIYYEKPSDQRTEAAILDLISQSAHARDFSYDSKIEMAKEIQKAQGNLMTVGIGIAAILALIGILNYMNTAVGNIRSRQVEFSIMESIGMTSSQLYRMLIFESLLYMLGSLVFTMTAGLGITYMLYQAMNYRGAAFQFPLMPILAAAILMGTACVAIPLAVYHNLAKKEAIAERIKRFE